MRDSKLLKRNEDLVEVRRHNTAMVEYENVVDVDYYKRVCCMLHTIVETGKEEERKNSKSEVDGGISYYVRRQQTCEGQEVKYQQIGNKMVEEGVEKWQV